MKKINFIATAILILLFADSGFSQTSFTTNTGGNYFTSLFGVNAGAALGATSAYNTFVGTASGISATTALGGDMEANTFIGASAGYANTSGGFNTFLGYAAGFRFTTGNQNVVIKSVHSAVSPNASTGSFNTLVGVQTGEFLSGGSNNSLFGNGAGYGITDGSSNTCIGPSSGYNVGTGSNNTFVGGVIGTPGNINNAIILADGASNQRLYFSGNGYGGVGLGSNNPPSNTFEIRAIGGSPSQSGFIPSGLRLTALQNAGNFNPTPPTTNRRVLSVNGNGDVILVDDVGNSGINFTSSCGINNFVPKSTSGTTMTCSQISDNGATVGIGFATAVTTLFWASTPPNNGNLGGIPNSGSLRMDINGITRGTSFFSTSDGKFKKDVMPIDNALDQVMLLSGKTYHWNRNVSKTYDFDTAQHSGFIAQELEKVFPNLVITDNNGDKAVNYIELIPYLVEAIKTQQTQIYELKSQITENFQKENTDLISLQNTKIISVSPNPSSNQIVVSLNIEKSVTTAKLQVHDLNGNVIGSFNITERDNNISKTLLKDNYGKGIYVVSLVVNGKSIDTKKIVLIKNSLLEMKAPHLRELSVF